MYKRHKIYKITAPDGTKQFYIKMDPEFIAPAKDVEISWICPDGTVTSDPLGEFVSGKATYSFDPWQLGPLILKIEEILEKAGLRKTKSK